MQFNEGCFYPGLLTSDQKYTVLSSEMYSVAMLLHVEYQLYISYINTRGKPGEGGLTIEMCDMRGFPSACLSKFKSEEPDKFKYECRVYSNASDFNFSTKTDCDSFPAVVTSQKIRYLMNALAKMKSDTNSAIALMHVNNDRKLKNCLQSALLRSFNELPNSAAQKAYPLDFSLKERSKLMELAAHNMAKEFASLAAAPPPVFAEDEKKRLLSVYQLYHSRVKDNQVFRQQMSQYFAGDRFVLLYPASLDPRASKFVLFGEAQWSNYEEAVDHMYYSKYSFYDGPDIVATMKRPFRRYANVESLPEDVREVVLATLHLDKMNRKSKSKLYDDAALLPQPYETSQSVVFTDSSSTCYRGGYEQSPTLYNMPDKRRLLAL